MKINPYIIEGAIASEVKLEEKLTPSIVIAENSQIERYKIGDEYFLSSTVGNSMSSENIYDKDLVIYSSNFELQKEQLVLIRMSDDEQLNAGKLKLRFYDGVEEDEKTLILYKYIDKKKVYSKGKHRIDSIEGIPVKVLDVNIAKDFLNEYSEKLEVKILKNDNTFCAKFNNIDYFLNQIEAFSLLSKEHKKSVNNYIIDTTTEYGNNKEDAKNNFNVHFQEGLSVFLHLKSKKEKIDKLSRIYFKFLELASNQIEFS